MALTDKEYARCAELLSELIGTPISLDLSIANSGADSLTIIEWFFVVEDEFGVVLDSEMAAGITADTTLYYLLTSVVDGAARRDVG